MPLVPFPALPLRRWVTFLGYSAAPQSSHVQNGGDPSAHLLGSLWGFSDVSMKRVYSRTAPGTYWAPERCILACFTLILIIVTIIIIKTCEDHTINSLPSRVPIPHGTQGKCLGSQHRAGREPRSADSPSSTWATAGQCRGAAAGKNARSQWVPVEAQKQERGVKGQWPTLHPALNNT